jgi:hypothetical protein
MSNEIERSVFVEAKAYFDKTGGNSYFSARIHIDGKETIRLPFQYGYESQYQYSALQALIIYGYTTTETTHLFNLRNAVDGKTVDVYTALSWVTKREAKLFGAVS